LRILSQSSSFLCIQRKCVSMEIIINWSQSPYLTCNSIFLSCQDFSFFPTAVFSVFYNSSRSDQNSIYQICKSVKCSFCMKTATLLYSSYDVSYYRLILPKNNSSSDNSSPDVRKELFGELFSWCFFINWPSPRWNLVIHFII
jgi:hypothetical protein